MTPEQQAKCKQSSEKALRVLREVVPPFSAFPQRSTPAATPRHVTPHIGKRNMNDDLAATQQPSQLDNEQEMDMQSPLQLDKEDGGKQQADTASKLTLTVPKVLKERNTPMGRRQSGAIVCTTPTYRPRGLKYDDLASPQPPSSALGEQDEADRRSPARGDRRSSFGLMDIIRNAGSAILGRFPLRGAPSGQMEDEEVYFGTQMGSREATPDRPSAGRKRGSTGGTPPLKHPSVTDVVFTFEKRSSREEEKLPGHNGSVASLEATHAEAKVAEVKNAAGGEEKEEVEVVGEEVVEVRVQKRPPSKPKKKTGADGNNMVKKPGSPVIGVGEEEEEDLSPDLLAEHGATGQGKEDGVAGGPGSLRRQQEGVEHEQENEVVEDDVLTDYYQSGIEDDWPAPGTVEYYQRGARLFEMCRTGFVHKHRVKVHTEFIPLPSRPSAMELDSARRRSLKRAAPMHGVGGFPERLPHDDHGVEEEEEDGEVTEKVPAKRRRPSTPYASAKHAETPAKRRQSAAQHKTTDDQKAAGEEEAEGQEEQVGTSSRQKKVNGGSKKSVKEYAGGVTRKAPQTRSAAAASPARVQLGVPADVQSPAGVTTVAAESVVSVSGEDKAMEGVVVADGKDGPSVQGDDEKGEGHADTREAGQQTEVGEGMQERIAQIKEVCNSKPRNRTGSEVVKAYKGGSGDILGDMYTDRRGHLLLEPDADDEKLVRCLACNVTFPWSVWHGTCVAALTHGGTMSHAKNMQKRGVKVDTNRLEASMHKHSGK